MAQSACVPPKPDASLPPRERVNILIARAELLFMQQPEMALAELKEALDIDASNAQAWHFSARYKLTRGDWAGAWADLTTALRLDPSDSNIWATRGSMQRNSSDALHDFGEALHLDPSNLFALTNRIYLNQELHDEKGLQSDLDALAKIQPDHPMLASRRADAATARGDYGAAIDQLNAQLAREPGSLPILLERAKLLQTSGDHEGAVRDLSVILGNGNSGSGYSIGETQAAGLYFARAISLNALKRGSEAQSDITRALRSADTRLLLRIQVFLIAQGYKDVAVTGTVSPHLLEAAASCMRNPACGRGLTQRI